MKRNAYIAGWSVALERVRVHRDIPRTALAKKLGKQPVDLDAILLRESHGPAFKTLNDILVALNSSWQEFGREMDKVFPRPVAPVLAHRNRPMPTNMATFDPWGQALERLRIQRNITKSKLDDGLAGGPNYRTILKSLTVGPRLFTIAQCLFTLNCTWEEFGLTYDAVVKTKNLTTRDIPLCSMSLVATLIQHGTAIQSAASFSTALPGAHLFACFVEDASMPPLTPGDVIVIDPDKTCAPDAFVLVSHHGTMMIRQLRVKRNGSEVLRATHANRRHYPDVPIETMVRATEAACDCPLEEPQDTDTIPTTVFGVVVSPSSWE